MGSVDLQRAEALVRTRQFITDGERLAYYFDTEFFPQGWERLRDFLRPSGRSEELSGFFRLLIATTMAQRVVLAGRGLADRFDSHDPVFVQEFTNTLRELFSYRFDQEDRTIRLSLAAVKASQENHPNAASRDVRKRAKAQQSPCYMCGVQLAFGRELAEHDRHRRCTIDHIWPQHCGGNSLRENYLPACEACNSKKKAHRVSWANSEIQGFGICSNPDTDSLDEMPGFIKFAAHYRRAETLAYAKDISLKRAFVRVGPWRGFRVINPAVPTDFFNLGVR